MKKLGAYIGDSYSGLEKNTFAWYEVIMHLSPTIGEDVYEVSFWNIKGGYPNERKPDVRFKTTDKHLIEITIVPMKDIPHKYCIEWENCNWKIKNWMARYDYLYNYECITELKVDQFGPNNYTHREWRDEGVLSILKNAKVNRIYELTPTIPKALKEELKKSLEQDVMKSALNSCYGMGGFTTTNDFISNRVLSVNEALEIWENKNKETRTMEKKMTDTDIFLKNLNGITITSTYSKLDHSCGKPYYIYYPEMEITEDIADTLLTVLIMAKRDYIKKVVFNPEKGTTAIARHLDSDPVTVRCRDGEFDYILGYEMARSKMYFGSNDYKWFNKIKNHRKTHIEYTEKKPTETKAKRTSKKGGKK